MLDRVSKGIGSSSKSKYCGVLFISDPNFSDLIAIERVSSPNCKVVLDLSFLSQYKVFARYSILRAHFQKLKKLVQQGFIKKKVKTGDFAGDDRTEFKLTEKGVDLRNKLVKRGVEVMYDVINNIVEEKIGKESLTKDE